MKSYTLCITTAAVIIILSSQVVFAADIPSDGFLFTIGSNTYYDHGQAKQINTAPYIATDGRTMIQLNFLAQILGFSTYWDEKTNTDTVPIAPDMQLYFRDGDRSVMGTPKIIDDHMFVPLRLVARSFSWRVDWVEASQNVILTPLNPTKYFLKLSTSVSTDSKDSIYKYTVSFVNQDGQYQGSDIQIERNNMEKIVGLLTEGQLIPNSEYTEADRIDNSDPAGPHSFWYYFGSMYYLPYTIHVYKGTDSFYDLSFSPDCTTIWIFNYTNINGHYYTLEDMMGFSLDKTDASEIKLILDESMT